MHCRRSPEDRLTAAEALKHQWLATDEEQQQNKQINIQVFKSMRRFAACTAIQRAALGEGLGFTRVY